MKRWLLTFNLIPRGWKLCRQKYESITGFCMDDLRMIALPKVIRATANDIITDICFRFGLKITELTHLWDSLMWCV